MWKLNSPTSNCYTSVSELLVHSWPFQSHPCVQLLTVAFILIISILPYGEESDIEIRELHAQSMQCFCEHSLHLNGSCILFYSSFILSFSGCLFTQSGSSSTFHQDSLAHLCCNYSQLARYSPSVFINGSLTRVSISDEPGCRIVYVLPLFSYHDGLEIAVAYGTQSVGRWNATLHVG